MEQIRITSDGTATNTHVYHSDGTEIRGISKLVISVEPGELVTATLTIDHVWLEMKANTDYNFDEGTPI